MKSRVNATGKRGDLRLSMGPSFVKHHALPGTRVSVQAASLQALTSRTTLGDGGGLCRHTCWVMASTSCLVRMPLRSSNSTRAEVSHMVEMASASRVTRSLGSSCWAWRSAEQAVAAGFTLVQSGFLLNESTFRDTTVSSSSRQSATSTSETPMRSSL